MQQLPQKVQAATDVGTLGLLAGVWANILPTAVSLVTLVWFCLKIYESETMQKLIKKKKDV